MRKIVLIFVLMLLSASLFAQVINPSVKYVPVAPSGACAEAPPVQVVDASGAICTCGGGTWTCGGSGGSGTVSDGAGTTTPNQRVISTSTANTVTYAPAYTINFADYGAVADDSTDNCTGGSGANNPVHNFLAAVNAYAGAGIVEAQISMPAGGKAYKTSCGFAFISAWTVVDGGGTIDHTGTDNTMTLGKTGQTQTVGNYFWAVHDLTFIGGATASAGIYLEPFNAIYRVYNNKFYNFGNASNFAIDAPLGEINEIHVYDNSWWSEDSVAGRNFTRTVDSTSLGGNSIWFINNVLAGGSVNTGQTAPCAGIGLDLGASHSKIVANAFYGFSANIRVRDNGQTWEDNIDLNSFDAGDGNCALDGVESNIQLGNPATSGDIDGLTITGSDVCRGTLFDQSGSTGTVVLTNSTINGNRGACSTALTSFSGVHTNSVAFNNFGFTSYPDWGNPQGIVSGTGGLVAASTPSFSPTPGTYLSTQSVTPSCTYGTVECNVTGSAPLLSSCSGISVTSTATVSAGCFGLGYTPTLASALYTITTSTLTGWWPCNEGTIATACVDQSGNTNNLTLAGTQSCVASYYTTGDVLTYSLCLDGSTNYGAAAFASDLNSATLTVSVWLNFKSITPYQIIASNLDTVNKGGWEIGFDPANAAKIQIGIGNGSTYGNAFANAGSSTGSWIHVCATYDGTTGYLWINGVQQTSTITGLGAILASTQPVTLGGRPGLGSDYANANEEDLRVYNGIASCSAIYTAGPQA